MLPDWSCCHVKSSLNGLQAAMSARWLQRRCARMPNAPMRICSAPGCPEPTRQGRCVKCAKAKQQQYETARGTRQERGYDTAWYRWRAYVLSTYDLAFCGDRPPMAPTTTDSLCQQQGLDISGDDLDHIQPIVGKQDTRRLDPSNVQFLCDKAPNFCHSKKRQRESAAARRHA